MTDVAAPSRLAALVDFARREPGQCLAVVLVAACRDLDRAAGAAVAQSAARSGRGPGARARMAARLLEASAAAVVARRPRLPDRRRRARRLPARAARRPRSACMWCGCSAATSSAASTALIAVLALEGIHFFNFSVPKFAHDQMQLPFWALTGLFLYRAIDARPRASTGCSARRLRSRCASGRNTPPSRSPAASRCSCCSIRRARRTLLTPGPVADGARVPRGDRAAISTGWSSTGFMPLRYVDARAKIATHWYHVVTFPLQWTASQIFFLAPAIGLMALALGARAARAGDDDTASRGATSPCWRSGRSPSRRWWRSCSAGCRSRCGAIRCGRSRRSPRCSGSARSPIRCGCDASRPASSWSSSRCRSPMRSSKASSRSCATVPRRRSFPAASSPQTVTQRWREKFDSALPYVGGGEFATNNIAVYSADRPRVIVHADLAHQPVDRSRRPAAPRRRAGVGGRPGRRRGAGADCARLSGSRRAGADHAAAPDLRRARRACSRCACTSPSCRRGRSAQRNAQATPCRPPRPRSRPSGPARRGRRSPDRSRTG